MRKLLAVAVLAAIALPGCGGERKTEGGTATVLMSSPPDYLDPQLAYTPQAAEADWLVYTPLLTYRHAGAPEGNSLIPGLAQELPRISPNGRRYVFTLRRGLAYSDGQPVRARDFAHTIERALRLGWGGSGFLSRDIRGAQEFAAGKSRSISGITTDDATGTITIELRRADGAFANLMALPATGLVPSKTPLRNLSSDPPPGVGPYEIEHVSPNGSFSLAKNPRFAPLDIPGIPTGNLERIVVRTGASPKAAARQVLENRADGLDPTTRLPVAQFPLLEARAPDRYSLEPISATEYFFFNTTTAPFSSELARRAVVTALDRPALVRKSGEVLDPGCYLIPPGVVGHSSGRCPYGDAGDTGDRATGRQLVRASGTAGESVTVWTPGRAPERAYAENYARTLRRIGYRARVRPVAPERYLATVESDRTGVQTGVAAWFNDFPNPSDFYSVVASRSDRPGSEANLGRIDDPFIQEQLQKLDLVPATELSSASGDWQDLDGYVATKAYLGVIGYQRVPKLMSQRMNFDSAVVHPLFLSDWSTWSLRLG